MPRLTAEERASISKVDQWIAAGGGQAPAQQPGVLAGAPAGTLQTSGQHGVRRAGEGPPRVKRNAHPEVLGPEGPAAPAPAVATAAAGGRENAAPHATAGQGGVLDASVVVSDFVTGVAALLSGAGTDAVKSLAQQALCGPTKTAVMTAPKATELIEAYDGVAKTPKRPSSSAKERQPLAVWPSPARPSATSSSALVDSLALRVGARRKEPPADLPYARAKQPSSSAKARRISAIF